MIDAQEVDFWGRDAEQLKLMAERRMYPPRFTVCVTGSSATGPSSLQVKFAGSQQKLNTEIMLPYIQREGICFVVHWLEIILYVDKRRLMFFTEL